MRGSWGNVKVGELGSSPGLRSHVMLTLQSPGGLAQALCDEWESPETIWMS